VFFLVGLLDDPSDELFGFLSRFWKQLEGNHVQHLNGLIELGVNFFEVHHPKYHETQAGQYDIDIQHYRAQIDSTCNIFFHDIFPRLQHLHQCWNHKLFICDSDLSEGALIIWNVVQQKLRVNKVSSPKFTVEQTSAFVQEVRIFRSTKRFVVYLGESFG
jgi:hypothetical protein